jgi:hypothetical protein
MARKRNTVSALPKPKGMPSRGRRKLTDEQVLAIVSRYRAGGVTQKDLATDNGVSQVNISAILNGRTYVWLTRIGLDDEQPAPLALAA